MKTKLMYQSEKLAAIFKKQYRHIKFDRESLKGAVNTGTFQVEFCESGNDPAVIVTVKEFSFKTNSEYALEILEQIKIALRKAG